MGDRDLFKALVNKADGYRDRAPVFRTEQPDPKAMEKEARSIARFLWPFFGDCQPRLVADVVNGVLMMQVPEGGDVGLFHPSGAIAGALRNARSKKPLVEDERKADRKAIRAHLEGVASEIARSRLAQNDELKFESLWERKAQGVTLKGEKTHVTLIEVVGAFRRYLHGLPVLGRASVHVGVSGAVEVTKWGIDWRRVVEKPFADAAIVDPKEGAKRVMDDMAWRRPERAFSLDDFEPAAFQLGYMSFGRRVEQRVMQPVWVAVLKPRGATSMGQVVTVPAAPQAYEPLGRPMKMTRSRTPVEA